jgi:hypothetical protein
MIRGVVALFGGLLLSASVARGQPAPEPPGRGSSPGPDHQRQEAPTAPWLIDESVDAERLSPPPTAHGSSSSSGDAALGAAMGVFPLFYVVFIGGIVILQLGLWAAKLLAVYDCARRDFDDPNTRAIWCLLVALTYGVGAIVYYLVVYRAGDPAYQVKRPPAPPPPMESPP